jgi:hypothetical protein
MKYGISILAGLAFAFASAVAEIPSPEGTAYYDADKPMPRETFVSRHFKILGLDGITRYLYSDQARGQVTDREMQYKISTRMQLNLTDSGSTYLQARGETGNAFDGSWNNTAVGLGTRQGIFNVKSLFLGQKFGGHFESQVGGIEFDSGSGSQATYAAGEAWLTGYRLRFMQSGQSWRPDKLSVTVGQVSDFGSPNVFSRFYRMGDANYVQMLVGKKLGESRDASLEADSIANIAYLRSALHWGQLHTRVADDFLVEAIGRVSHGNAFAWSTTIGKNLDRVGRCRTELIYNDMPPSVFGYLGRRVLLNWGEIPLGKRVGLGAHYRIARNLDIDFLGSRRVDSTIGTPRWRGFVAARYDFSPLAQLIVRAIK